MRERAPGAGPSRPAAAVATAVATAALFVAGASVAAADFLTGATASATLSTDTLQAPSSLTAGSCLIGAVSLSWTATPSTWADGYEIRWGTSNGGPYNSSTTSVATSETVSGLSALTTYYFVVRAYEGGWRSGFTNQRSVSCLL